MYELKPINTNTPTADELSLGRKVLEDGLTPTAARDRLVELGFNKRLAEATVRQALVQRHHNYARTLRMHGSGRQTISTKLVKSGLSARTADQLAQLAMVEVRHPRPTRRLEPSLASHFTRRVLIATTLVASITLALILRATVS